jgi:hypothetical protein
LKTAFLKICSVFLVLAGTARAQLVNGNFGTGDLTGWSVSDTVGPVTPYGLEGGGTAVQQVVSFDTEGTGTPVNSAEFEVGETQGMIGGGQYNAGIVIYQYVPLQTGLLTMSVNIAAYDPSVGNGDAGTFQLLLDGNPVATDAMGGMPSEQTIRSSLSFSGQITGGTHQVGVEILRAWGTLLDATPDEYLANFQLTGAPEPSVWALLSVGTTSLFLLRRVRH